MGGLLLAIRLVLVVVLAVAGVAKLADREGTRAAVAGFGIAGRLAAPLAVLLPVAELIAAALLLAGLTARAGAALALVLMLSFTAAIARSISRGETPDCHCFGQIHSAPAGPRTLARNVVLSGAAATVVITGAGTSATAWVSPLSTLELVELVVAVALAVALATSAVFGLRLLKRHGALLLRIDALETALASHGVPLPEAQPVEAEGLPVGTPAPDFELTDLRHRRVTLRSLRAAGRPVLLVFTDPGCGPCSALMPELATWQREHGERLRIALISRGEREGNLAHAREHGLKTVLIQRDREIDERYLVSATPSAVLVDGEGLIASPVHAGGEQILALVMSQTGPSLEVHHHEAADLGTIGAPAPDPALQTLDGEEVALSTRLQGTTLVLFWNPACGFCERMLEDVRRFDAAPPPGATSLVLISTGDPAANRAMNLRAPVLLDDSFRAGNAFGAAGTPSAVLVDRRGRIASEVAVGADAVLQLAGFHGPSAVAA
jgi:uncharacterized membrane protein YphA (DoxX/SURF4 family)/peroxiredoxin